MLSTDLTTRGAVISPSDEDSHTFTVNTVGGDAFRLRAYDAKERQHWVSRLRAVTEIHTDNLAASNPPLQRVQSSSSLQRSPRVGRSRPALLSDSPRSQPDEQGGGGGGGAGGESMHAVRDVLTQTEQQKNAVVNAIEVLPGSGLVTCVDEDLLVLKASSEAAVVALQQCMSILQRHSNTHKNLPSGAAVEWLQPASPGCNIGGRIVPITHKWTLPTADMYTEADVDPADAEPDAEACLGHDLGAVDDHKSVILHLLSQLKLGMDLTRVVLPTFILEQRSLLEMFADFMGHPALFLRIASGATPEDRMMALVEWYLTAIHAGRQVINYHLSAFYIECPARNMCMNAHVWTKSKFMGMSIGVAMVGEVSLTLLEHDEEYIFQLPSAFARSILTVPWVELGGKVNFSCASTKYAATATFHTKPFYGGKLHRVTADVKDPMGRNVCHISGDWSGGLDFTYADGTSKNVNVAEMAVVAKRVRPLMKQHEGESRRLWQHVSESLKNGNMNLASEHKHYLEEMQRADEKDRAAKNVPFPIKFFHKDGEGWKFKKPLK
ncbi:PREDICTED: oxysterol-binding protein-related protein 11-like [Priapulus caudatus]|uniref:Oxysterol-binding protein-related protein 11-like n=1 Tax=Priapulus caudatus TaxID=37621 RepID=A0ABM1ES74_PRICU|nr:PREDICTED: oxysterol-binding protein-related protein 11-like [Priapulus caudatus]